MALRARELLERLPRRLLYLQISACAEFDGLVLNEFSLCPVCLIDYRSMPLHSIDEIFVRSYRNELNFHDMPIKSELSNIIGYRTFQSHRTSRYRKLYFTECRIHLVENI